MSLGWPISHWVALFSSGVFHKFTGISDQLSKLRGSDSIVFVAVVVVVVVIPLTKSGCPPVFLILSPPGEPQTGLLRLLYSLFLSY